MKIEEIYIGTIEELCESIYNLIDHKSIADLKIDTSSEHSKLYISQDGIKQQLLNIKNSSKSGLGKVFHFTVRPETDEDLKVLGIDPNEERIPSFVFELRGLFVRVV